MAVYFASDMHLRLDRPDRAERLRRLVDGLDPSDRLYLVGDICDFWFASRQIGDGRSSAGCAGLAALAAFRARGGDLTVMTGNHDLWLGPYYERVLGARIVEEPHVVEVHGMRFHLVHGHRAGGRQPWKAAMESRAFLQAFRHLPGPVARRLDRALDRTNERGRAADETRLTRLFETYADGLDPSVDLAIFGHVHRPLDNRRRTPRLVILGGWHHQASYLRVDEQGAELVLVNPTDPASTAPL